jgi:hypothetical protein
MWVFYHDVTQASVGTASHIPSDVLVFCAVSVLTAAIVMAPSFFERRIK